MLQSHLALVTVLNTYMDFTGEATPEAMRSSERTHFGIRCFLMGLVR